MLILKDRIIPGDIFYYYFEVTKYLIKMKKEKYLWKPRLLMVKKLLRRLTIL